VQGDLKHKQKGGGRLANILGNIRKHLLLRKTLSLIIQPRDLFV